MKNKNLISTFLLSSFLYYVIPLLFLKFYTGNSDKLGLILILFYICAAFSINIIISFFFDRRFYTPLLNTIISIPLLFIFNTSAIVLICIVLIFSFLGYTISSLLK